MSTRTFLSCSTIKNVMTAMFIINTDIVAEKFTLFKNEINAFLYILKIIEPNICSLIKFLSVTIWIRNIQSTINQKKIFIKQLVIKFIYVCEL